METKDQISAYINAQSPAKSAELQELHDYFLKLMPGTKLWFLDGRNEVGKIVSNPNIGYGSLLMKMAGGKTKAFYQFGLSANTTGISIYVMGLKDKNYLKEEYSAKLGKAQVSGYCIKFRSLKDIHLPVVGELVRDILTQGA